MSPNAMGCRPKVVKNGTINKNRRDFLKTAAFKWVDFGPLEDLEPGSVSMLPYEFLIKDGWLVLPQRGIVWAKSWAGDQLTVFSSVCTHLSCNIIWQEETNVFECPCHAGRFDANGQPISGPPKKPMTVLEHKIEDGKLLTLLTL
jgi:menaquinol-cytochrome c reductase iron-sulfur subunit